MATEQQGGLRVVPMHDAGFAMRYLGIKSRPTFWQIVRELKVPRQQYGPRAITFSEPVLRELKSYFTVTTDADLKLIADARRSLSWLRGKA